jgi:Ala-tRNA(Pro) deacylase
MPETPESLLAHLTALGIPHRTYDHPAVFTVEEAKALRGKLPGGHCKSLFLKDKKGALWLAVMLEERRIDLRKLADALGAARFSFGSSELLLEVLGVTPGSVTPFALINDRAGRVRLLLDAEMLSQDPLNYHPLVNTRTTAIAPQDLLTFVRSTGHEPVILNLSGLERPPAASGMAPAQEA